MNAHKISVENKEIHGSPKSLAHTIAYERELEAAIKQLRPPITRYVQQLLNDSDVVDDILQNTWIQLYLHWIIPGKPIVEPSMRYWAQTVAHNFIRNYYRDNRRLIYLDPTEALELLESRSGREPSPEEIFMRREEEAALYDFLSPLSSTQREIFYLRYIKEYTTREISMMLHLPQTTVRSHLYRGIMRLRKKHDWLEQRLKDGILQEFHFNEREYEQEDDQVYEIGIEIRVGYRRVAS